MFLSRQADRLRHIYDEYPNQFWTLVLATFIDRLGGALLYPFFTLYITRKFGVGMTQVGLLFGLFSAAGLVGSTVGGALTDRLGRKVMLIAGLIVSALSSLAMGVVDSFDIFFAVALFVGLFAEAGGPAQQAMVADLLPDEKRSQGFGILRVALNLAVTIGPAIGGLLAARSYLLLFISDAVASIITAGIVAVALPETMPARRQDEPRPTMAQTLGGYREVLRDTAFVLFLSACTLMVFVYMQMETTLAVYLRDVHGVPEQGFGLLLSLNAAMVVLFQFPITRQIRRHRPLMVMAAGTLLYAVGFSIYGFVSTYVLFLVAMVIITTGEMLTVPTSQTIVAQMAPEDMRGRYMAAFGFSYGIPFMLGTLLAGLVMDYGDPRWVWYGAGLLGLVAAACFGLLQRRTDRQVETPARVED